MAGEKLYQEFTPQIVERWEAAVQADPLAVWNENRIGQLLPFVREVQPRIGVNQSLFGLSIISLEGRPEDESEVVMYGLEPLIAAGVLDEVEAAQVVAWYERTDPSSNSGSVRAFGKEFDLGGTKYRLITDAYGGHRDLNLQVV